MTKTTYFFKIPGFGERQSWGKTKSQARYRLWLEYSEAYPCTFFEFMKKVA